MGGGYYGETAVTDAATGTVTFVDTAPATRAASSALVFENKAIHTSLDPRNTVLRTTTKSAVIVAIDVTGSMGSWTAVLWKKMPMFFGQMCLQGYLTEPSVCFAAVGDAYTDTSPLQVAPFGVGAELDSHLQKIWLEGGGGGQGKETYELAAYHFSRHCDVKSCTTKPFLFITGDEMFYDRVNKSQIFNILGERLREDVPSQVVMDECLAKFEVFLVHKPNSRAETEKKCMTQWKKALGEDRVLYFEDPNAIVDVMLGAIAITSGARTLGTYTTDLRGRGQNEERIKIVGSALAPLQRRVLAEAKRDDHKAEAKETKATTTAATTATATATATAAGAGAGAGAGAAAAPKSEAKTLTPKEREAAELKTLHEDLLRLKISHADFPEKFVCPLSQEPFLDPVLADDRNTYERAVIEDWFKKEGLKSPLSDAAVESSEVMPDLLLIRKMKTWRDAQLAATAAAAGGASSSAAPAKTSA